MGGHCLCNQPGSPASVTVANRDTDADAHPSPDPTAHAAADTSTHTSADTSTDAGPNASGFARARADARPRFGSGASAGCRRSCRGQFAVRGPADDRISSGGGDRTHVAGRAPCR